MTFQEDGTFVAKSPRRGGQRNIQTRRQDVDHYGDRGEREAAARQVSGSPDSDSLRGREVLQPEAEEMPSS